MTKGKEWVDVFLSPRGAISALVDPSLPTSDPLSSPRLLYPFLYAPAVLTFRHICYCTYYSLSSLLLPLPTPYSLSSLLPTHSLPHPLPFVICSAPSTHPLPFLTSSTPLRTLTLSSTLPHLMHLVLVSSHSNSTEPNAQYQHNAPRDPRPGASRLQGRCCCTRG